MTPTDPIYGALVWSFVYVLAFLLGLWGLVSLYRVIATGRGWRGGHEGRRLSRARSAVVRGTPRAALWFDADEAAVFREEARRREAEALRRFLETEPRSWDS